MPSESLLALDRRLEGLAGQAKAVFVHRQLEGMTHAQISKRLGLTVGRVHQLMTVALQCCQGGLRE
ncbi:RNA polymerase sigma factor [Pseudomonas sp. M47T1]|uniref:sigma factor-like helix-turn-helix DNA-binding protein n=1 Tax=unclassified Pseudomonas TaxID=196821 RepID=UPI00026078E3|nr:sigma factor-like helix-turn-helix DNA-binding protein [Pseudomonas sp. M47T1]EIK94631.1 RNA polymerase sigma factor [Pseudomonas sp. M47T1]